VLKAQTKHAKMKSNYFELRVTELTAEKEVLLLACSRVLSWFKFYVGPGSGQMREVLEEALAMDARVDADELPF
jgi:hypothetical protein